MTNAVESLLSREEANKAPGKEAGE
jgi:hypothetical protein